MTRPMCGISAEPRRSLVFFCAGLLLLGASAARAATPELGVILPRGGTRGTDVTLLFNGARLSDAREVFAYSPGITVSKLTVVNDNQVKVAVKIAADCRLGEHAFRLRTATGISELKTFFVGALPTIDEKEPNNDFQAPQKIPLNVTVNGVIDNEDVDYFSFEAKKGQRVTAEIEGMRLATTWFDPYVAILDSKRFELAASDDCPLLGQDAVASVIIPADGKYIVQVRESAYGGNGACYYRLHVGTFPRPLAVLPAGGKPGEEVEVRFLGDVAGEIKQKIRIPDHAPTSFGVFATDSGGIAPSANPFRVNALPNVMEVEPNHTHDTATRATVPAALNGVISKPGEVDHFRFSAKAGQVYDINCYARRLGSPLDSVLYVAPAGGPGILGNDDAFGPDSYIRFQAPDNKDYVILVTDHLGRGGPTFFYRIEVTTVTPRVTVSIPKVALYSQERQTIPVPKGNRYATLVSAARADCGGDLVISAEGLPAKMTAQREPMAANLDTIPVVFEAAADAPVAGSLARLSAKSADPKQNLVSEFNQVAELVIGPPNQSIYWRYEFERAACAVTEEVPFKIQVIEPKVPLVQNGSMNLKVVAERKPGFKAPIAVYPLFNPPGVSTGVATIGENQTEALVPVSAVPNAQVRKWKTALIAYAGIASGPVWVSSQLFTLDVAPPLVMVAMERAAGEQGKAVDLFCKVQVASPFSGPAKIHVVGLPPNVKAPEMEITKDTKEFAFKTVLDKTSPAGLHKNIFCQLVIVKDGEPILHNVGGTELRIDVPIPVAPAPAPAKAVAAKPQAPPPSAKRLTRLEQLRQEQAEREKAVHPH